MLQAHSEYWTVLNLNLGVTSCFFGYWNVANLSFYAKSCCRILDSGTFVFSSFQLSSTVEESCTNTVPHSALFDNIVLDPAT